jgi:hypothetical protein
LPSGARLTATDQPGDAGCGEDEVSVLGANRISDSRRHQPAVRGFARIVHEVIGSFFANDPPQFYVVPYGYHPMDPIKEALTGAGFTAIRIAVLSEERDIPDAATFARGMVFGNPVIEQIRARGGVDPDRIADALAQAFLQELGSNPCRTPMQTITFEARRRSS